MAEFGSFVVATEASPRNWLHSADIVLADADTDTVEAAVGLAQELLRRYPGAQVALVLVRS
jgi:hypothetical protein